MTLLASDYYNVYNYTGTEFKNKNSKIPKLPKFLKFLKFLRTLGI